MASEPAALNAPAITGFVSLAVMMQAIDTTIANVSLPYMQANMSASLDEIGWVLTSYIVSAAIMTPPTGFLAARFGTRRFLLGCILCFTVASMLCGSAQSLSEIVGFRILQGITGAALVPLAQAILMGVNSRENLGKALAWFSAATMVGPLLGPVLGGWLTENYNWRWVFYINLPVGILTFTGLATFLPRTPVNPHMKLDWLGFATLSIAIGALQLMIDRGNKLDWFDSVEICIEAIVSASAFYLFLVHLLTTTKTPFVSLALFQDRNFIASATICFLVAILYFSTMALQPVFIQRLMNYPIVSAGLLMVPRGIGMMVAMSGLARFLERRDTRYFMAGGLLITAWTLYQMTSWTPDVSSDTFIIVTTIQGVGLGCIFLPLNMTVFASIPAAQRTEGSAIYSLFRNLGGSIGITTLNILLVRNTQVNHAQISAAVTPVNRMFEQSGVAEFWNPATSAGQSALNAVVTRQAEIIAYIDDYKLLMLGLIAVIPFLLMLRKSPHLAPT